MPSRIADDPDGSRPPWRLKIRSSTRRQLLLERLQDRFVFASLSGIVFEDANQSWRLDAGEVGLDKQVVYVDLDGNSKLDDGEPVALTDSAGKFQFDDLSGDSAIVRLFNGRSGAPAPYFPVNPTVASASLAFTGGSSMQLTADGRVLALAGSTLVDGSLSTNVVAKRSFDGPVKAAQLLADGRILVLSDDSAGHHAFFVDANGNSAPVALGTSEPDAGWSSAAVDSSGNGVLLEESDGPSFVRGLVIGSSIQVGTSSVSVGAHSRLTGGGELTTIISTPIDGGLKLRLWSNATSTEITSAGGVDVSGASEVLSYNDANGLVLVRNAADSYSVLDAAAGFASLQTIQSDGVVALDGARDLLYSLNSVGILKIIDLGTAQAIGTFLLPPQVAADAEQLLFDPQQSQLLILNGSGVQTIAFSPSFQQVVPLVGAAAGGQVTFAIPHAPLNTPPKLSSPPLLSLDEDTVLSLTKAQWLGTAVDSEDDQYISLLSSPAVHGTVTVTPNGKLTYVPNLNYFGSDSFDIILHDGITASQPITLDLIVFPVNDKLVVSIQPNVVPENVQPDFVAATLIVTNVDGGTISWNIDDPRFVIKNDQLLVAPGAAFDFETEPTVDITLTGSESNSSEVVSIPLRLTIGDVYESIKEIRPDTASVKENVEGDLIAELSVVDDGNEAAYEFTVDDDRFEVLFRDLKLKAGVSLDYEAAPSVTIHVTAHSSNGQSKTEPLVISVIDAPEAIGSIDLSRRQILELVRGAEVGDVQVNGNTLTSNYVASVDDSRFEIVGGKLKLRSNEFLRRADQQEVQLTVTVTDPSGTFSPLSESFVIDVLANDNPFHNSSNPYDVNGDGEVTPLDALVIINVISQHGGPGPISGFPSPTKYYDVNGDGFITALDALLIINYLNRHTTGTGEGEQVAQSQNSPASGASGANGGSTPSAQKELAAPQIVSASGSDRSIAPVQDTVASSVDAGSVDAENEPLSGFDPNSTDLKKLRDLVVDMLSDDPSSANDEIEAALNDFVTDKLV